MDIKVATPDKQMLMAVSEKHRAAVECIVIDSQEMLVEMNDEVGRVEAWLKKMEADEDSVLDPLKQAAQAMRAIYREPKAIATACSVAGRNAIGVWMDTQERKRQEEQRRLEDLARKERERLSAEAAAAEAKARQEADEQRRKAEEARAAGKLEQAAKLEAKADAKEAAGFERASELQSVAAVIVAPPVEAAPKVAGLSARRPWKGRVINEDDLWAFLATPAGKSFRTIFDLNGGQLNTFAKSFEGRLGAVLPGTESYQETQIARRAS